MASNLARLIRRPISTFVLLRSYRHVRSYSHSIFPGASGPVCSKPIRELIEFFPRDSPYRVWSRSLSSESGDLFDAVVPFMGESITDGTLATFLKKPGDRVEVDEPIAQIETDKVTIDVTSPEAGVIQKFVAEEGDTVSPGTKVAVISKSAASETHVAPSEEKTPKEAPKPAPASKPAPAEEPVKQKPKVEAEKPKPSTAPPPKVSPSEPQLPPKERERRVRMPRLRQRIANRLKDSQNTFALLTTFNEVDMTNLMKLRSDYKDAFTEKHGVKLGLMSGFVKAAVSALLIHFDPLAFLDVAIVEVVACGTSLHIVGLDGSGRLLILIFKVDGGTNLSLNDSVCSVG